MLDEIEQQLALRSKLLTLTVATTGALSLAATTTGYTRAAGSFITDGFAPGMEITPAGFVNNSSAVITEVTALTITAKRIVATTANGVTTYALAAITAEAAAGSRSLTVGLPIQRAWENDVFEPTAGIPWIREEFTPGPSSQVTIGPFGELEGEPQYVIHFNLPAGTRLTAKRYTRAAKVLFAPRTIIPLANGDTIRVRADTAPLTSQLIPSQPGFAAQSLAIPLEARSANII